MNLTPEEQRAEVLARRRENMLQMTVRYLARMGKSVAAAYPASKEVNSPIGAASFHKR